jgi:hypothetical protein
MAPGRGVMATCKRKADARVNCDAYLYPDSQKSAWPRLWRRQRTSILIFEYARKKSTQAYARASEVVYLRSTSRVRPDNISPRLRMQVSSTQNRISKQSGQSGQSRQHFKSPNIT